MGSTTINTINNTETKEENADHVNGEVEDLEWSADQEILLLYSLHGYKPVGPNKHFRMLLIQERLSNAMNKRISSSAIWKKLNTLYDLEALDEAEAEADALNAVETEFSLPEDEFGELMAAKLKQQHIKIEKSDTETDNPSSQRIEATVELKPDTDSIEDSETDKQTDGVKSSPGGKEMKKDMAKKGSKKKDTTPIKDNSPLKKDNTRETPKKDTPNKKDNIKETKKVITKDDEKKDVGKKLVQESKKEISKEDKKEPISKANKKEATDRRFSDQLKKDAELKKADPKKVVEVAKVSRADTVKTRPETPKQLRAEASKRTEAKTPKNETNKTQRNEITLKLQRSEALKKEISEKKKETPDKKGERKSPEKTPESARGAKLRAREKKEETETPTGTKRERSRDAVAKAIEAIEEPPAKKAKTQVPKGRPTRNSIEPQKPVSPVVNPPSPQKRRTTRLL